jgi:DNA-binding transcriptional MerR regulator
VALDEYGRLLGGQTVLMDLFGENNDAPYLGIGDVLSMLQAEFPDVTVSKLRFLESKGLVEPERTPSGFRKFRVADVERLRWILRQQKEHFLPLRVIKERLERGEDLVAAARDAAPVVQMDSRREVPAVLHVQEDPSPSGDELESQHLEAGVQEEGVREERPTREEPTGLDERPTREEPPIRLGSPTPDERPTREELCSLTGLREESLSELEEYGLIAPKVIAGIPVYGQRDVEVAKSCAVFISRGLEARHLRSYLHAAGRDADLIEQVVTPLLRQRNPRAREAAQETARELAQAGISLHRAMVLRRLEELLGIEVALVRED